LRVTILPDRETREVCAYCRMRERKRRQLEQRAAAGS